MEEGKKEEADNCIINPGRFSAHNVCILSKEYRRHKYKNRKLLIHGIIETKRELQTT
jgi:hypothetical protein